MSLKSFVRWLLLLVFVCAVWLPAAPVQAASSCGTTVESLKSLNALADPDTLSPGQVLRLW